MSNFISVPCIVAIEVLIFLLSAHSAFAADDFGRNARNRQQAGNLQPEQNPVHLYFADSNNRYLISEPRVIAHSDDPVDFGTLIVEALIQGPKGRLGRTLPAQTELRALFVTQTGVGYADLTAAVREMHPGGSQSELLSVYSIVNSLILNVPAINKVKILIDGKDAATLAGHVDIIFPMQANMLLIR